MSNINSTRGFRPISPTILPRKEAALRFEEAALRFEQAKRVRRVQIANNDFIFRITKIDNDVVVIIKDKKRMVSLKNPDQVKKNLMEEFTSNQGIELEVSNGSTFNLRADTPKLEGLIDNINNMV